MEGTGHLTNIPLSKLSLQVMLFPENKLTDGQVPLKFLLKTAFGSIPAG